MGIDVDGGMLVGCHGSDFAVCDDCPPEYLEDLDLSEYDFLSDVPMYELLEHLGLESYAGHYDADYDEGYIGFPVPDVPISSEDFNDWLCDVKIKALRFKNITGVDAKLIGCQKVW